MQTEEANKIFLLGVLSVIGAMLEIYVKLIPIHDIFQHVNLVPTVATLVSI